MSSILPLTAQGSDMTGPRPTSSSLSIPLPTPPTPPPLSPPLPPSSHDSRIRIPSNATSATATTISLANVDGPLHLTQPGATSSSSLDVGILGTDIPQRPASTPTPNLAKRDRAKPARKDAVSALPKEILKDTRHSADLVVKDAKEQRATAANGRTTSPSSPHPSSSVDPLSHYIFTRTNTERSIASRLLNPTTRPESPSNESSLPRPGPDIPAKHSAAQPNSTRDKKKGVSFLGRLSMIGGKKKGGDIQDDESELSEQRTEGANAVAFSAAVYIPHHKQPPRYIRVRAQNKRVKEFDRIFLAQELVGTQPLPSTEQPVSPGGDPQSVPHAKAGSKPGGPIWAVEFSQDGRFLATGGRDRVLRVWAVIATEEDRQAYDEEENANTEKEERLSAPVFHSKPAREFKGHEGDILDLSWSKNNFLLSSSMDKTVRLWHMSRRECLCTFKHKDFVASIAFHPRDDRFFLAGSLDSSLRLWSIPDKAVAYSSQLSDIITAVGFSPDGKTAIAGTFHGFCMFYETEGLKHMSQVHVRSSRGKNAKGSKITGIQTMSFPPDNADGQVKLLVTSNDSRIRIYNMADKTLEAKLKGHENATNQIRASFSDDGAFVICGSEDRKAFIWSREMAESDSREKGPGEYFEAHADVVTAAIFAPTKTRQLLQASQDPIFTLCNPPPVTLRSKEESTANLAPAYDTRSEYSANARKPEETPAFIARSAHHDGNIIVTTDNSGIIKVFRQDCAFNKRRHDNWETNSSLSRKLGRDKFLLARAGSIMTGTSVSSRDPHSRRGSLTQPLQISSDRINTWRYGVEGNPSRPLSFTVTPTTATTPAGSVRSPSPTKPNRTPVLTPIKANHASEVQRKLNDITSPVLRPVSPATSSQSNKSIETPRVETNTSAPPTPSFTFRAVEESVEEPRLNVAGAGYSFWNLNKWRNRNSGQYGESSFSTSKRERPTSGLFQSEGSRPSRTDGRASPDDTEKTEQPQAQEQQQQHHHHPSFLHTDRRRSGNVSRLLPSPLEERDENEGFLVPPERTLTNRTGSILSRLSSELTASEEGEEMECVKCGNHDFRAKRVGGLQRLLCGNCGRMVDV
ncbi:WD40-repeat-containing domain protein [Nemania sp. NC0429]|nr:WD40-repeat-containing domain protein [Nemania sp. NC0429]